MINTDHVKSSTLDRPLIHSGHNIEHEIKGVTIFIDTIPKKVFTVNFNHPPMHMKQNKVSLTDDLSQFIWNYGHYLINKQLINGMIHQRKVYNAENQIQCRLG